ncbi:hypothetical protein CEUSTIGMA_g9872.t1 [Chlamydomonas eustigma]|uniref:Uncharacterized protein n=1 Tax=Chlamydomonas eustigma TaxID=1157962 RepID=A0A250XH88_9CHLO|nr:hypothetical protein CEUSTIGMA_g9872.t1 [Chlamydomonas eustigma]|eukprot:GAX82444.1 hypothetical protein CEUSTIGMA_g9872.t1 [Chlamydomonas eustigma]
MTEVTYCLSEETKLLEQAITYSKSQSSQIKTEVGTPFSVTAPNPSSIVLQHLKDRFKRVHERRIHAWGPRLFRGSDGHLSTQAPTPSLHSIVCRAVWSELVEHCRLQGGDSHYRDHGKLLSEVQSEPPRRLSRLAQSLSCLSWSGP